MHRLELDVRELAARHTPPILEALELLGVRGQTAAAAVGVRLPQYSRWKHSFFPIPVAAHLNLLSLLESAAATARDELCRINGRAPRHQVAALRARLRFAEAVLRREGRP